MKLLTYVTIGLNLFSASLGFFGANENWSVNLNRVSLSFHSI